jgi:hypothetical protein
VDKTHNCCRLAHRYLEIIAAQPKAAILDYDVRYDTEEWSIADGTTATIHGDNSDGILTNVNIASNAVESLASFRFV